MEQGRRRVEVELERAETGYENGPFRSGIRLARASDAQRDRLEPGIRCDQIENGGKGGKRMDQFEIDEVPELENLRRDVDGGKAQIFQIRHAPRDDFESDWGTLVRVPPVQLESLEAWRDLGEALEKFQVLFLVQAALEATERYVLRL